MLYRVVNPSDVVRHWHGCSMNIVYRSCTARWYNIWFCYSGHYCNDYHMNSWNLTGTHHLWIAFQKGLYTKIASRHFEASTTSNDWKGSSRIFLSLCTELPGETKGRVGAFPIGHIPPRCPVPCLWTVFGGAAVTHGRGAAIAGSPAEGEFWRKPAANCARFRSFWGWSWEVSPKWWRYDGCRMKSS